MKCVWHPVETHHCLWVFGQNLFHQRVPPIANRQNASKASARALQICGIMSIRSLDMTWSHFQLYEAASGGCQSPKLPFDRLFFLGVWLWCCCVVGLNVCPIFLRSSGWLVVHFGGPTSSEPKPQLLRQNQTSKFFKISWKKSPTKISTSPFCSSCYFQTGL